jgi:hypothetical protein
VAPRPLAVAVDTVKSRPRSFRSNAEKYDTPAQSPLGVPESSNVMVVLEVWMKVNVTP